MSFETLLDSEIQVGKATKRKIFTKIKGSLDEHETRINALAIGAAPIEIFNIDVANASHSASLTGLLYHEVISPIRLSKVQIQIFNKGAITTGQFQIDIKRNTTPDDVGMVSLFTTKPTINFATAVDYQKAEGVFDIALHDLPAGTYLRLDITALPSLTLTHFRVLAYGVI